MSKFFMSPILSSSLEVMEHAIQHLKMGTERDMKFAVQHADNAVELLLKELARSKRIRLITRNGQSLTYYACITKLEEKGINIPELTDIDLLHTERNAIYHLGNQPDKQKAEWLTYDVALKFIERICKDEFGLEIVSFSPHFRLSKTIKDEIKETKNEIVNMYLVEALNAFDSKAYSETIIHTYSGLEAFFKEYFSEKVSSPQEMMDVLKDKGMRSNLSFELVGLQKFRNRAAHGELKATREQAKLALEMLQTVITEVTERIPKNEKRREIKKRLLPEHYENWEKMLAWVDSNTRTIVNELTKEIKKNMENVVVATRGRYLCFFKGKPSTKSIFAAFLLTKKYLNVKIRVDPTTFIDPEKWLKEKVYRGWFFKSGGQERLFSVFNQDAQTLDYAIKLIKQSYELAK